MKTSLLAAILVLSSSVHAADTPSPPPQPEPKPRDAILERFGEARDRQDWTAAASAMREGVLRNPGNADYHNLYAYSLRRGANPNMSRVFKHYNAALAIDPAHRGAHEYLGEAYLMVNNVEKAKEHLAILEKICVLPCSEAGDLKVAINRYLRESFATTLP